MEKDEIVQNEQFSPFSAVFSMLSVSENPLIATFQLSSAATLNLGLIQNGVLGIGLNRIIRVTVVKPFPHNDAF